MKKHHEVDLCSKVVTDTALKGVPLNGGCNIHVLSAVDRSIKDRPTMSVDPIVHRET